MREAIRNDAIGWLIHEFEVRRRKNPKYSLRSYARHLGVSAGKLSEVLRRKRALTTKMGVKITKALKLSIPERSQFLDFIEQENKVNETKKFVNRVPNSDPRAVISKGVFESIADWEHYAILNLMRTKGFRSSETWIADRLGVSVRRISRAIENLIRVGLIRREGVDLKRTKLRLNTTEDINFSALRRHHKQNIELALKSLERDPVELREITSITLAVNMSHLPEAKRLIRKFKDAMETLLEAGNSSEVYNLNIQLVPLTMPRSEEESPGAFLLSELRNGLDFS